MSREPVLPKIPVTRDTPHMSLIEETLEEYYQCLLFGDYKRARELEPKLLDMHEKIFHRKIEALPSTCELIHEAMEGQKR